MGCTSEYACIRLYCQIKIFFKCILAVAFKSISPHFGHWLKPCILWWVCTGFLLTLILATSDCTVKCLIVNQKVLTKQVVLWVLKLVHSSTIYRVDRVYTLTSQWKWRQWFLNRCTLSKPLIWNYQRKEWIFSIVFLSISKIFHFSSSSHLRGQGY